MRITRDLLLSTAKETVKRATFGNHDLVCAYLTGSLVLDDPLIGGSTDIDLIYVHNVDAPCSREIIPMADEFHLDITHYSQSVYSQPRKLRTDAWIGSFVVQDPILLFDTQYWFDYARSGISAHFFHPPNAIERVKPFAESARSQWMALQTHPPAAHAEKFAAYLQSIRNAANAVACLVSVPLTDRRFLLDYPQRTLALGAPGLSGGLVDLIVPEDPIDPDWEAWLSGWRSAYDSLQGAVEIPLKFSPARKPYYEMAIQGLKESHQQAALWLLLWTWSGILCALPDNGQNRQIFEDVCRGLMLAGDDLSNRMDSLDAYLDSVEETIERWAAQSGI